MCSVETHFLSYKPQEKPAVTIAAGFSLYMADNATDFITHMGARHE